MTIKAILRNGTIHPVDPLPTEWLEGQELLVEQPESAGVRDRIDAWADDLSLAVSRIPTDEHDRFLAALDEVEKDSKELVRREWGLP